MDEEIVCEGWITKSPPLERSANPLFKARWRRRWFALQQGKLPNEYLLNYYSDETKRRLKGTIFLDDVEQVDSGLTAEDGKNKYDFMFDIKTPKRIYFLAVDSKDEMTTWVRMICSACGLQSTKDEDASYPPPSMTNATLPTQTEEVKPESLAISSPYIHISTCYSGKPPPPKPERTNPAVVDLKAAAAAKPSCDHEEDDSVFEAPEKPRRTRNEVDVMISNLTLQNPKSTDNGLVVLPPGRPPKPSHLSSSSAGKPTSFASNYENSNEMEELCSSEQNNNKNRNDKSGPEVSRSLKPGRQASRDISKTLGAAPSSSSRHQDKRLHSATLGPPVKRNLKPRGAESMRHISGLSTSWSNSQNGRGSSDSDSDFESRRNSGSEEQIYFYMPPADATGGTLIIPADSFEHPSFSYIDLDLSNGASSKPPPKKPVDEKETIYKTVDFEKTDAFNRTKQVVESERYGNNSDNSFFN